MKWSLVLTLALCAIFIAAGFAFTPVLLALLIAAFLFTYRYTLLTFYAGLALTPFLGLVVSIPTGRLIFGERAFGGSIDVSLAEVILFFVLAAWALKLFVFWVRQHDTRWQPRFPLFVSYLPLVVAHVASAFSPFLPEAILVAKFAFRPVLYSYLAFIALPVNFLRSRKRLVTSLAMVAFVGTFAAATGGVAMFTSTGPGLSLSRAHPLPIFGIGALGENHNELAELLVFTSLASLAFAESTQNRRARRLARLSAALQFAIGLLTFTRTAWIVFAFQAVILFATVWKESIKKHARALCLVGLLLLPLAGIMGAYTLSDAAKSSNSTRLMLSQIAWSLFRDSPVFGAGAGSFIERVGSTRIFLLEYGAPLDSHGILQKIGAETGALGLLAFGGFFLHLALFLRRQFAKITYAQDRRIVFLLIIAMSGALTYQLFNTSYWNGKMWLPIGLTLAAAFVFSPRTHDSDEPPVS